MSWLPRRRRTDTTPAPEATAPAPVTPPGADAPGARSAALAPLVPAESLQRTERALRALAAQSAQFHAQLVHLEHRIDAIAEGVVDRLDVPTFDDVLRARSDSARVAAELARLEVNLAARLDAVRAEIRSIRDGDAEVDLRARTPNDTGWATVG